MTTLRSRFSVLLVASLGVAVLPVASTDAVAAPGLSGIDLGTLGGTFSMATAVNESGRTVGWSYTGTGASHAFSWTSLTGMIDIGTLGGDYAVAYGVNDGGIVVGRSATGSGAAHAFVWDATNGMTDLGTLGGASSVATKVNSSGAVVGMSDTASGATHSFVWDATNGMTDLGTLGGSTTLVSAINDAGHVVGQSNIANNVNQHGFVWDATNGMTDLGTLGGQTSTASGINASGQISGTSDTDPGAPYINHGYLWTPGVGMADAGSVVSVVGLNNSAQLAGDALATFTTDDAVRWSATAGATMLGVGHASVAINNSGEIAGGVLQGFVVDRFDGVTYLAGPVPADFTAVNDLNDAGQAVGYWADNPEPWFSGNGHAMLWTRSGSRSLSVAGASIVEGDSGKRTVSATVTMSTPSPSTVTVHFSVVQRGYGPAGTFADGFDDFKQRFPGGTLTFKPQLATGLTKTSAVVTANVVGDLAIEGSEHFEVVLDHVTGPAILGTSQVPMTILDDDLGTGAEVSVGDSSIWEGDSGTKNTVQIPITLRTAATSPMTVRVTLGGGTATAGNDFTGAITRTVKFPIGAAVRQISITVPPDLIAEGDETIFVTLSAPTIGLSIARGTGTVTIRNDDA